MLNTIEIQPPSIKEKKPRQFNAIKLLPLSMAVASCGGGDDSDNVNNGTSDTTQNDIIHNLFYYENYIYEATNYVDNGRPFTSIQTIFLDLDSDGIDELIIPTFRPPVYGTELSTATESALVILSTDEAGILYARNNELSIVATEYVGAMRRHDIGDINGDGNLDVIFAVSNEDGRNSEYQDYYARPIAFLSNIVTGNYEIARIGLPDWGHSLDMVSNELGYNDALFGGYTEWGLQALRFIDGNWIDVRALYPNDPILKWANSIESIDLDTSEYSTYLAVTATSATNDNGYYQVLEEGIKFYGRASSQEWTEVGSFFYTIDDWIPTTGWYGKSGYFSVLEIDEGTLTGVYFHEILSFTNHLGNSYFVAKLGGDMLRDGINLYEQTDITEGGDIFHMFNQLKFFQISDSGDVILVDSLINGEITDVNYNFMNFSDINNDGYIDLVVEAYSRPGFNELTDSGGHPIVYLGDESGDFSYKDISYLPKHQTYEDRTNGEMYGTLRDLNNDGFVDLVLVDQDNGIIDFIPLHEYIT